MSLSPGGVSVSLSPGQWRCDYVSVFSGAQEQHLALLHRTHRSHLAAGGGERGSEGST